MIKTKPFSIPKDIVQQAYQRVKDNRGSAGIDEMSLERFEEDRKEHLEQQKKIMDKIRLKKTIS